MPPIPPDPEPLPPADGEAAAGISAHVRLEADLLTAGAGSLPVAPLQQAAAPGRRTFLVVDDDPGMRLYVRRCLTQSSGDEITVLEAADGLAALERARQGGIDGIISDIVMPRLDGLALCRALQADAALRHLPVLLVTGEAIPSVLPDGVGGVLAKPFNAASLRAVVDRLFGPLR